MLGLLGMEWKGIWNYVGNFIPGASRSLEDVDAVDALDLDEGAETVEGMECKSKVTGADKQAKEKTDDSEDRSQKLINVKVNRENMIPENDQSVPVSQSGADDEEDGSSDDGDDVSEEEDEDEGEDEDDDADEEFEEIMVEGEEDNEERDGDVDGDGISSSSSSSDYEDSEDIDTEIENNITNEATNWNGNAGNENVIVKETGECELETSDRNSDMTETEDDVIDNKDKSQEEPENKKEKGVMGDGRVLGIDEIKGEFVKDEEAAINDFGKISREMMTTQNGVNSDTQETAGVEKNVELSKQSESEKEETDNTVQKTDLSNMSDMSESDTGDETEEEMEECNANEKVVEINGENGTKENVENEEVITRDAEKIEIGKKENTTNDKLEILDDDDPEEEIEGSDSQLETNDTDEMKEETEESNDSKSEMVEHDDMTELIEDNINTNSETTDSIEIKEGTENYTNSKSEINNDDEEEEEGEEDNNDDGDVEMIVEIEENGNDCERSNAEKVMEEKDTNEMRSMVKTVDAIQGKEETVEKSTEQEVEELNEAIKASEEENIECAVVDSENAKGESLRDVTSIKDTKDGDDGESLIALINGYDHTDKGEKRPDKPIEEGEVLHKAILANDSGDAVNNNDSMTEKREMKEKADEGSPSVTSKKKMDSETP
ncbi:dentin sialophosphoprotein-like [Palaemon carinicauda]|uniref:dentin sialophosphoprotein-like n=1 Tax=Palaemon carinicauda TaxID=392227 RepID=UPI0035B678C7